MRARLVHTVALSLIMTPARETAQFAKFSNFGAQEAELNMPGILLRDFIVL